MQRPLTSFWISPLSVTGLASWLDVQSANSLKPKATQHGPQSAASPNMAAERDTHQLPCPWLPCLFWSGMPSDCSINVYLCGACCVFECVCLPDESTTPTHTSAYQEQCKILLSVECIKPLSLTLMPAVSCLHAGS